MNRIARALERAEAEGRAALVTYFCVGDPSVDATIALARAAAEAGADVLELGMPFSDPTADGPAIQRASERALASGMTLGRVLEAAREIRRGSDVGLLLFGYYNPILSYGEARLVHDAKAAGIDGVLVVDLPPEEAGTLRAEARREGLEFVPLAAPTTDDARLAFIGGAATCFVYYVSVTGVTGSQVPDWDEALRRAAEVRRLSRVRVALGFGVTTAEDVRRVAQGVDAVVVGSALVRTIESAPTAADALARVRAEVRDLRAATARAR